MFSMLRVQRKWDDLWNEMSQEIDKNAHDHREEIASFKEIFGVVPL